MWVTKLKKNKVFNNAIWIIACRIVQAMLAFIINMITARYLGPSNFGLISYAASIVAFVVPIMRLGIDSILVQEIVNNKANEGKVVGTAMIINFIMSIMCIIGVITFSFFVNSGERETLVVCSLYSVLLIFQSIDIIQYWFQAKLLSKYTSIVMLISYTVVSIYKIYILINNKNVYWFAISNTIDYFIIAVALVIIYFRIGTSSLSFSMAMARELVSKGRYFIIANLMVTIFVQADRIMLKMLVGNIETGIYAAAYTCAGATAFIFAAIIDSARPVIFESKLCSQNDFEKNVVALYSIIIYSSFLQCILMTAFAKVIVNLLYGDAYIEAVETLQILVWYTTFSYLGSVRNIWIIAEKKQKVIWILNLAGVITNLVLNYWCIPIWGSAGAAIASLITQIFTNVIMGFILKPIRHNNKLMISAINPKYMLEVLKNL